MKNLGMQEKPNKKGYNALQQNHEDQEIDLKGTKPNTQLSEEQWLDIEDKIQIYLNNEKPSMSIGQTSADKYNNQDNGNSLKQKNRKLNLIIVLFVCVIVAFLIVHYWLRDASSLFQKQNRKFFGETLHKVDQGKVSGNNTEQIQVKKDTEGNGGTLNRNQQSEKQLKLKQAQNKQEIIPNNINNQLNSKQQHLLNEPKQNEVKSKQKPSNYFAQLNDFKTQQVYMTAPPDIKQIFDEMVARPPQKTTNPNKIFNPSQKAYFAYRLFKDPQNQRFLKAQYYYYDHKYSIGSFKDQIHLCIIAPGRNLAQKNRFRRFIDSIQRQNYTNYQLVYIDDASDDNSPYQFQNYILVNGGHLAKGKNSAQLYTGSFYVQKEPYKGDIDQRRFFIVKNTERVYALANRNKGIRNYCPSNSVVLDVDADDAIIGKQAFKFVNSIYHDENVWTFNSVFIYDKTGYREVTTGPKDGVPQNILQNNIYRVSMVWKTSQLRTFRTKLFLKINETDFKDEKGIFYQWASDVFTQQPLVELAGPKHYKHLYQIVYFYDWDFDHTTVFKRRHFRDIAFMQTPYKPLESLDDSPQRVENYVIPSHIREQYEKNIVQGRKQAIKYHRQAPF